ncbi:MAG: hypothetical protein GY870_02430 [archaeon]|nr:hypothetical protein [archaeon]
METSKMKSFKTFLAEGHSYGCIMGMVDDTVSSYITEIQRLAIPESIQFSGEDNDHIKNGIQFGDHHCTIKYGLTEKETKDPEIWKLIQTNREITYSTGIISYFDQETHTVVKLSVISPGLMRLNKEISERIEYEPLWNYEPHITIAYIQPKARLYMQEETKFDNLYFKEIHISPQIDGNARQVIVV